MSTEDHPDWQTPVGGSNARDSLLERRSTIANDNGIVDGEIPPVAYPTTNYIGKFFTRGMRGKIERIEIYAQDPAPSTSFLRYSPHPCLGPINEVAINVAAPWAWYGVNVEEMWDYDSLFIWFRVMGPGTTPGSDVEQPHDSHLSGDAGATWADVANRLYIRVIYTAETPGDVPISGIINNIPIPYTSSEEKNDSLFINQGVLTNIVTIEGIGYLDFLMFEVDAAAGSELTSIEVVCDGVRSFLQNFNQLNTYSFAATTPSLTLLVFAVNGTCVLLFTKRFEFRRILEINAINAAGNQTVTVWTIPNLLR